MEALVRFVVSNRLFTVLFALTICLLAWVKLPELTISQNPMIEVPTLAISAVLPGASAKEIEARVVNKLEEKLENTRKLKKFTTKIRNSSAAITMEYLYGVDIDDAYIDINSKVNNLKSDLPADTEITVIKQNPIELMISFVLAVTGDTATEVERYAAAERVKDALRSVSALEEIEVMEPEEEITIDLDTARMARYGVGVQQVSQAIRGNNQFLPTGTFTVGEKTIAVVPFAGGYQDLDALRDTMLISASGSALALRDIATVQIRRLHDSVVTRHAGQAASWITSKLNANANVFEVRTQMEAVLEEVRPQLQQEGMQIDWLFDVEPGVAYKMTQLITNILQGIGILTIVLLFAVGYRSAFVIAMMLPLALGLSVVGLSLTGYGLQGVSLAGFIISLGLIVDNGIVVTENAYKLQNFRGMDREQAAITGTSSVLAPLISSTLTTALAFAPLFLLTSMTGLFLRSLVVTIWLCLAASLVVAVTFSSMMLSRIGTDAHVWKLPRLPSFMMALRPFRDKQYATLLRWFIRRPWVLAVMVLALLWVTAKVAALLPVIVFPPSEEPYFSITVEAPDDRSQDYTSELAFEASRIAREFSEVEQCSTIVGAGFPFVDTGIELMASRRNHAMVFCEVGFRDARQLSELTDRINLKLKHMDSLARVNASPFAVGGESGGGDIELLVSGPHIEQVREYAREIEEAVRSDGIEGIRSLNNPARSRGFALEIKFRERVANALGVSRGQVDQVLVLLTHGSKVDELRTRQGDEYDIILRADRDFEDPLAVFDRLFVTNNAGNNIPLSQLIEAKFGEDEYDIEHRQFRPTVKLLVNANPGVSVPALTTEVERVASAVELEPGYRLNFEGEAAKTAAEFGGAGKYTAIIGVVILAIFVLQFRSFMQPLVVCAAIPLSFYGAFFLLYLTDQPISFLAFIGLTSLMGIVVNNSILLVDEGNQLRALDPEKPIHEVAVQAGVNRFMPIVLTSITSIFGLLPLAVGNSLFKALAVVVIGGLTTSTFLTLLCVPVLYARLTRGDELTSVTGDWSGRSSLGEKRDN